MSNDEKAWKILNLYATDEMTLPVTEAALKEYLGDRFLYSVWETTLKRIIGCEGDAPTAGCRFQPTQILKTEEGRHSFSRWRQILQLNLPIYVHESAFRPPLCHHLTIYSIHRKNDTIVAYVRHEEAVARGEVIEVDDSDEEEEDESQDIGTAEVLKLCQTLEKVCLSKGDPEQSMELTRALRIFRGHVKREELLNSRQMTLAEAWGTKSSA
ncbi:hypothetical protein B0H10DRAFT_1961637 [Mycena sp. CBHHK59/15]|nr:hypothetical protein B0H10DRAFT_1961637 [Mycena sp. CBHHK59/15]